MKRHVVLSLLLCLAMAPLAAAQQQADTALIESPFHYEPNLQEVSSVIACSITLGNPDPVSLFGATEITGGGVGVGDLLVSSLGAPFAVHQVDENCMLVTSWNSGWAGTNSVTGIAFDPTTNSTYWQLEVQGNDSAAEFDMFTGTPTGNACTLVTGVLTSGGMCTVGTQFWFEDIVRDKIREVNLPTDCTLGCNFFNPDASANMGSFGNGIDDAEDTSCGATIVVTSGTDVEGRVTRAGQADCGGTVCPDTWDIDSALAIVGETFANGIVEFDRSGTKSLGVAGNVTSTFYIIEPGVGVKDCQGVDDEEVFTLNGSNGGSSRVINLVQSQLWELEAALPSGGGNGKYVLHMNNVTPDVTTINTLPFQLGVVCHTLLNPLPASLVSIFNNIGKTNQIGGSNYFGTPQPNPAKAPGQVLFLGNGDPTNMPAGSEFTLQGVILNPASSSTRGGSVTNAFVNRIN